MPKIEPDFSGWATVYDVKCTDGRTIRGGCFDEMDGVRVPLVWQHQHDNPENVMGYCILHSVRGKGVRADGYLNDTDRADASKKCLAHGDVDSLSIYANKLQENSKGEVFHGDIIEVSLVLRGANNKARVDYLSLHHSEMSNESLYSDAVIYNGVLFENSCSRYENDSELKHSDDSETTPDVGINSADDCIAAYSALTPDEQNAFNLLFAKIGMEEQIDDADVKELAQIIESKDQTTQVKLLTLIALASD